MLEPDDKDWTWVLERPCPECGFEAATFDLAGLGDTIRGNAATWAEVLAGDGVAVRTRDDRWSALEYACHVRDVFRIYDERLALMLTRDDPLFPNWDQDATAVEDDYVGQEPSVVAAEVMAAGERLAAAFDAVEGEQWARPGRRSDGASFTVESFARYFVHDPIHHLADVGVTT